MQATITRGCLVVGVLLVCAASSPVQGHSTSPLIEAIKAGDRAAVQAELKRPSAVHVADPDGTTALHWAIHDDRFDLAEMLVRAGADVNVRNRYGVLPLSLACENGNPPIVQLLLQHGADAKAQLADGETVLMIAARSGSAAVLRALIAAGVDVNARERLRGQTALMWAAAEGNADAVRVLVGAGAHVGDWSNEHRARPSSSGKAFNVAGADNLSGLASKLDTMTPLLFAVRGGHIAAVRALLDSGATVNTPAPDGTTALLLALINAHWELASMLLDEGADPNAATIGWTPLHQLAQTRRLSIGHLPPPEQTGTISSLSLAEKLIVHGADVNARMARDMRDGYRHRVRRIGATALFLAAKNVDVELMRFLIANGADPTIPNTKHTLPLLVAAGVDMYNPGTDPGTEDEVIEAVNMLLQLGNNIAAADDDKETPLHGAAYRGFNRVVQLLVDGGARLDAKNIHGWTPYTIAEGVNYVGFFKSQPHTAKLLHQMMEARGIPVEHLPDAMRTDSYKASQP